jgi:hypothetical protein
MAVESIRTVHVSSCVRVMCSIGVRVVLGRAVMAVLCGRSGRAEV